MTDGLDFTALDDDDDSERVTSVDSNRDFGQEATLPHADAVYANEDGSDSADDVDPRLLFRNPTVNEIRWYARFNGVANTIVHKPIRDAFKNGYDLLDSNGQNVDDELTDDVSEWEEYYKEAKIKARRDGPSAIFYKLNDDNDLHEPPSNVSGIAGMEIMTLDKWDNGGVSKEKIIEGSEIDIEDAHNIDIRDSGLVVYRNISSADHRKLLGYVYRENDSPHSAQFIHADRCQHFACNTKNDGNVEDFTVGEHEGDSILLPIFIPIKSLMTANWAMGQTVFRYSAPLYAVETPEQYGQDEFDKVNEQVSGLNSASDIVLPPGTEMSTEGNKGDLDPSPYVDKLIEQCCAGTEFTKSVLMGTQTGTVSGSSTDIKNYFNQVQRDRKQDYAEDIRQYISLRNTWGLSSISSDNIEIEWGPLFKMDDMDRMEAMVRVVTAASNAVENYMLKPSEAREILAEEWATLDIEMDLDELDDDEFEMMAQMIGGESSEEPDGNPRRGQNGGGMEHGQTTEEANPT